MTKIAELLGMPALASQHGKDVDALIIYIHALMAALFIGWSIYFIYAVWRFRQKKNPKADHAPVAASASNAVEIGVAIVEGVLLLGFAIPWWAGAVDKFPSEKESVVIRVTGRQFNWIARYAGTNGVFGKQDVGLSTRDNPMGLVARDPELKATDPDGADDVVLEGASEVFVPVNTNVIMHISSLDVIHSFKVLALRVTQDAIPGMSIPIHFKATMTNTYQINCAQLCGNGHSTMKGLLKVLEPADYDVWLKSKSGSSGAPISFE